MKHKYKILIVLAALSVIAAAVYILIKYDLFHQVTALINEKTPAELFIPMMVFLPLVGVPLTFFLLLLGIKFGVLSGLFLLEVIIPVQILIAYFLAIGVRNPIESYLVKRKNYQIPEVPEDKAFIFSFFTLTFPVFPYSVKLYLLPLAGVKFRYCFWLNWAIQGTMCIPFVLLGRSAADLNAAMFGVTMLVIIAMFIFLRWAKKQYVALQKEKIS
ncbi:MAG: hypothetical protein HF978_01930 [Desulfobacteraceae bacterium]|nr:hypothetical protein [Desulfobacteraceae bacterium]MBC2754283.1 hypothetical protein [Desulfobacteraceae bacterium]